MSASIFLSPIFDKPLSTEVFSSALFNTSTEGIKKASVFPVPCQLKLRWCRWSFWIWWRSFWRRCNVHCRFHCSAIFGLIRINVSELTTVSSAAWPPFESTGKLSHSPLYLQWYLMAWVCDSNHLIPSPSCSERDAIQRTREDTWDIVKSSPHDVHSLVGNSDAFFRWEIGIR